MKIYWSGESKNIIGQRIKAVRKARNWTQRTLAEKLQLEGYEFSDITILRIENGARFVPDYELRALAHVLDVSYEFLLDGRTL